jgi:hypothetical protein
MSDARFSTEELVDWADNILDGLGPEMNWYVHRFLRWLPVLCDICGYEDSET